MNQARSPLLVLLPAPPKRCPKHIQRSVGSFQMLEVLRYSLSVATLTIFKYCQAVPAMDAVFG